MCLALRLPGLTPPPHYDMHALIAITAWSDNINVYYDHWENGYDFDPANPAATADETFTLNPGARSPQSADIPTNPPAPQPTTTAAIGSTSPGSGHRHPRLLARGRGAGVQAVAWEIYPVKPQLTTYILPFGENLGFPDFLRTFVLIQATANDTTFSVDLDGNGTADRLDPNFNGDRRPGTPTVTLSAAQSFFLGTGQPAPDARCPAPRQQQRGDHPGERRCRSSSSSATQDNN